MRLSKPEDDPNEPIESDSGASEVVVLDGDEYSVPEAISLLEDRLAAVDSATAGLADRDGDFSERLETVERQIGELYEAVDLVSENGVIWDHR